jgi:hypothetical protein
VHHTIVRIPAKNILNTHRINIETKDYALARDLLDEGRAIAQAVSRWLPTATVWVRARVWSSGICGGQSGAGAGFLRVLRFYLPITVPRKLYLSHVIQGWYNGPFTA